LLVLIINDGCSRHHRTQVTVHTRLKDCVGDNNHFIESNKIHIVRKEENLYQISRMYNVSIEKIVKSNGIEDPSQISTGQILIIPLQEGPSLIWPVIGTLSSNYGKRGKTGFHTGLDISAPEGTPIKAVADGLVIISGKRVNGFKRYGRVVILEHGEGYNTLYAHNKENLVKPGTCIKAGQVIAEVGESGNATGSHLHFEIRKNGSPVNPLYYF
jgi:LysM repeat protein